MNNKELIKKHLERWAGLEVASIENYAKTGKISGFLYLTIEKMLDEKAKAAFEAAREKIFEEGRNMGDKYPDYETYSNLNKGIGN